MAPERADTPLVQPDFAQVLIKEHKMHTRAALTDPLRLQRDLSWMQAKCDYPVKAVEWEDKIALIEEHPFLEVFEQPVSSESAGSQVVYFARSRFRSPGVLIHGSKDGQITSDHNHIEHEEKFKKVAGLVEAHLEGGGSIRRVMIQDELLVPAGTFHQLRGIAKRSLTIIVTSGSEDCLDKRDHNYRPGNRFTI